MRTLIAIPCMDKVDTSFAQSLMYLARNADDGLLFNASSLIYDSRNQLGKVAVENKAEYILWLDSDMVFEPDLLMKLMASIDGKDFVSALYFKRRPPYLPCIFRVAGFEKGEGNELIPIAEHYKDYPQEQLFEIDACGFGAVLMRTEMIEKIESRCGLPFSPVPGFGEDISFCIKARQCGYKLYCDSSIKVGHTAHTVINETIYKLWRDKDVKQS